MAYRDKQAGLAYQREWSGRKRRALGTPPRPPVMTEEQRRASLIDNQRRHYQNNKSDRIGVARRCSIMRLLRPTGASLVWYIAQLHFQDDRCAICKRRFDDIKTKYNPRHTDHCHETMKFRGVICHYCNLMLGQVRDDEIVLRNAIAYLERSR